MRGQKADGDPQRVAPRTLLVVALFLVLGAAACRAPLPSPPLVEVLARAGAAQDAHASWPAGQVLVLEGPARSAGVPATARLALHEDGRFRLDFEGALARSTVFDGREAWLREGAGPARRLVLGERDVALLLVWVVSGAWLEPERLNGFSPVRRVARATADGIELALRVPGGDAALALELDRTSALPRALGFAGRSRRAAWRFEDWRPLAGRMLPRVVRFVDGEDEGSTLELARASWEDADPALFQLPREAADARFDPGVPAEVPARRAPTGHLFVPVSLNDGPPRWFLVDTGASGLVIDDDLARALGAKPVGIVGATGGAGRTRGRLLRARSLRVGPLTLASPTLLALELDAFAVHLGQPLDGILGTDLFARATVVLDIEAARADAPRDAPFEEAPNAVALYPPGALAAALGVPDSAWQPALAPGGVIAVRARAAGGLDGWFLLDTGAAWTLALHAPTLDRLGLPDARPVRQGGVRGIAGGARTLVVTLDWFELGAARLEHPEVHLALAAEGSLADPTTLGNLGLAALAGRRVVLDLAEERVAFLPSVK